MNASNFSPGFLATWTAFHLLIGLNWWAYAQWRSCCLCGVWEGLFAVMGHGESQMGQISSKLLLQTAASSSTCCTAPATHPQNPSWLRPFPLCFSSSFGLLKTWRWSPQPWPRLELLVPLKPCLWQNLQIQALVLRYSGISIRPLTSSSSARICSCSWNECFVMLAKKAL